MNDKRYLYSTLYMPAILLGLTLLSFYWLYDYLEQQEQQLAIAYQQQLREADALYQEVSQLQQKVALVNTYHGRFQQAYQSGQLAEASRVAWIDALMNLVATYDVRRVSLNFSARSPLTASELTPLTPMHKLLKQETIEFEGEFQHEADWLAFLEEIKIKVNPLNLLESCELESLNKAETKMASAPDYHFNREGGNVAVKCRFRFMIFALPSMTNPSGAKP